MIYFKTPISSKNSLPAKDKSVYAYTTYLQSIESGSTESFEINPISTELPDHDSVEVYVQNW